MTVHFLADPWAPHPIVNKHICFGGGDSATPQPPDYSAYISHMTKMGDELSGYGRELMDWAKQAGIKVSDIADIVSSRAGKLADEGAKQYSEMMANWKKTYQPLYEAQAADAQRMIGELPNTEKQYAGKYSAGVAQAFDASKEANDRNLRSYGLKAPGSGAHQLDAMVSNQRRLGQVAAAEQGRMAARNEARTVAGQAITQGRDWTNVAGQGANLGLAAGNQQIGAPESAISTTVGAYSPGLAAFNAATPYYKAWGDTMSNSYNQQLAASQAENSQGGSGFGSIAGTLVGAGLGAWAGGPAGAQAGASIGGSLGGAADNAAEGGAIDGQPGPGAPGDNFVDPGMSQSEGAITDDVPARLNVGEFVFPKDVIQWRGEAWAQKEIMKARKEREENTVAEPEAGPPMSAIDMQAPAFQSEGARL